MRRAALALLLAAPLAALVGCFPTRIPPPPEHFDTVVLTSDFAASKLYAEGLAAFLRANWEPLAGDDADALTMRILPDGTPFEPDGSGLIVRVAVRPLTAPADTTLPDLADADYAGPDLARRALSDPARGQNEPDSLHRRARPDSLTTGAAVLTASVDPAFPDARDVLIRTARILAGVRGTLSYR